MTLNETAEMIGKSVRWTRLLVQRGTFKGARKVASDKQGSPTVWSVPKDSVIKYVEAK
jgi:hypothetical protein